MSKIRTIKPSFFTSTTLARCSRDARLVFVGLFTESDDDGNSVDLPKRLAGTLFPLDEDIDARKVTEWVDELVAVGAVERYSVDGAHYLHIPAWYAHQRISHPTPSRIPMPPGKKPRSLGKTPGPPGEKDAGIGIGIGSGIGSGSGDGSEVEALRAGRPKSVIETWQARGDGEIPTPVVEKTTEPEPEPERTAQTAEPQMADGLLPAAIRAKRPTMGLGIVGQELRDRWPKSLAEILAWRCPTAAIAELVGGGIVAGQTVEQGWRLKFPHLDGKGDRPTLTAALTAPVDHWLRTAERGGMPWTWPERALVEIGRWVQKDHDQAKRSHTQDVSVKARGLEPVSDAESVKRYEQRKRDREAHAAARHHDPVGVPETVEEWLRVRHSAPADTVPIGDVLAQVQLKVVR